MALLLPPFHYSNQMRRFRTLIEQFNALDEEEHIERIFLLQQINYVLNNLRMNNDLFTWLNDPGGDGWIAHLKAYAINPHASFFLKGIQFAQAVVNHSEEEPVVGEHNVYVLMQERDRLLKTETVAACREQYTATAFGLSYLAQYDNHLKEVIAKQTKVLTFAHIKLNAIKGKAKGKDTIEQNIPQPSYKTTPLGVRQVNNFNFKFTMGDWNSPFIFRVEDRGNLKLEQELHSFPVARYFLEDYATFMMEFKDEDGDIEFKPVVLSQFASQGNLIEVAQRLNHKSAADIAAIAGFYFTQLSDFCEKLINAGAFHPDIKLSNFLVQNNRIGIADRKTLLNTSSPQVSDVRSSPLYAPPEFLECITDEGTYNARKSRHVMNMHAFMAYQLGIALKEFLILTQLDQLPDDFRDSDRSASAYFPSSCKQIENLSLLIQELTRFEANKRLTIAQFKVLLNHRNKSPHDFYLELEKLLPSEELGIQEDVNGMQQLLNNPLNSDGLMKQANVFFNKLAELQYQGKAVETRLTRLAEQLATQCFYQYSSHYFIDLSQAIEHALLTKDWNLAPWYRKVLHILTLGYFKVERLANPADIKIEQDLQGEEFQTYFPQLHFIPSAILNTLGAQEIDNFKVYIENHLDEIVIESDRAFEPVSTAATTQLFTTGTLSANTMVVNTVVTNPTVHHADGAIHDLSLGMIDFTLAHHENEIDLEEEMEELDSGTMVISRTEDALLEQEDEVDSSLLSTTRFNPGFFATPSEQPAIHEPDRPALRVLRRIDSVRSTLFRGDGSNRSKETHPRTDIAQVNWNPLPIDEELIDSLVP